MRQNDGHKIRLGALPSLIWINWLKQRGCTDDLSPRAIAFGSTFSSTNALRGYFDQREHRSRPLVISGLRRARS